MNTTVQKLRTFKAKFTQQELKKLYRDVRYNNMCLYFDTTMNGKIVNAFRNIQIGSGLTSGKIDVRFISGDVSRGTHSYTAAVEELHRYGEFLWDTLRDEKSLNTFVHTESCMKRIRKEIDRFYAASEKYIKLSQEMADRADSIDSFEIKEVTL